VSLSELRRRYAGEGAVEKRVQEATELRNTSMQNYTRGKQILESVMRELGSALFRRTVPEPSDALRSSNPTEYLIQQDLYNRESDALNQQANQLQQLTNQADTQYNENMEQMRESASVELHKRLPVLSDKIKGPKVKKHIVDAALYFGYTNDDIKQCADPNLFHMAYWAARGLAAVKKAGITVPKPAKTRTLPKKGSANRPRSSQSQRQQSAALSTARLSGKVDDVARTMLIRKPRVT